MADDWNPAEDAWLAGFTDGEASFNINLRRHQRSAQATPEIVGATPHFGIWLRADDEAILRALQRCFGGRISFDARSGSRAPRYAWQAWSKADLLGLVAYFERFPLRAKKARDFDVWRRAVEVYCRPGTTREKAPEMFALREALIAGRRYEQAEHDLAAAERAAIDATAETVTW